MTDAPAVEAKGLTKSFGRTTVLAGLDLSIARGAVFALLGPNGAGKTTTVRLLTTLLAPDGGRATVAGHDVVTQRALVRRAISVCGQDAALDELQTGSENLRMMGRLAGLRPRAARRRAAELLARFDLEGAAERRVVTYSGGMRRRLDLAASLVRRPEVLFLDEPTTGLDPRSRRQMWSLVGELTASGVTVLLTTQYLEEADRLADRLAVIDCGRVIAQGTPAELKADIAGHLLQLSAADEGAYAVLADRLGDRTMAADPLGHTLGVATGGDAVAVRAMLDELDPAGDLIARFAIHTASLDDVFMTLTSRRPNATESEIVHV